MTIPPWLRPYVIPGRTGGRGSDGEPQPLPFDLGTLINAFAGSAGNHGLVMPEQELNGIPPWLAPYVSPGRFGGIRSPGLTGMTGRSGFESALLY